MSVGARPRIESVNLTATYASRSASVGMILNARNVGAVHASIPIVTITLTPTMSAKTNAEYAETGLA